MPGPQALQTVGYRDFIDPVQKNEEWALTVVRQLYDYGGAKNLLEGKNVPAIFAYAAGNHSMEKFRAMFPEKKKTVKKSANGQPTPDQLANHTSAIMDRQTAISLGMDLAPLGILQQPLASALALLQKQEVYVSCDAMDATSNANRQNDLDIIRNRPEFEKAISGATGVLGMPLQMPQPEHNYPTVDISTLGLDPAKEDQLNIWANLFYKLRPETAFEIIMMALMENTNFKMKLDLMARDELYFGMDCSKCYFSKITDLPDFDYVFPGHVFTPPSELSDFSDQPFRYIKKFMNVEQILNAVGKENLDEDVVTQIFEGYWKSVGYSDWHWDKASDQRKQQGVPVVYMEFKSFDVIRVENKKTKYGRQHTEVVPFGHKQNSPKKNDPNDYIQNKWPQQTYYVYWVPNTDTILKFGKLEGMFRAKGKENKSNFNIIINKSKDKSDVEQCMTAVDDAQRAYIKMQLSVIMAKPKGMYIDFKYIRAAAETLGAELSLSTDDLVNLFYVKNIMFGDTEDMDGQNEGNFMPFREIPGGLGSEVEQYLAIIKDAHDRIVSLTGFNDALTGQTPAADQLVGIQKLMLQSSINNLFYAQKAMKRQVENTVLSWAPMVQYICKKSNKNTQARKAIENIIGNYKAELIADMDDLSVTQFGFKIENAPDIQQQTELKQILVQLLQGQRIELSDYFLVQRVMNYKDAEQILVLKERQKAQMQQQQMQQQQQTAVQVGQAKEQGAAQREAMASQAELQKQALKNQGQMNVEQTRARLQLQLKNMESDVEMKKKLIQGQQQNDKMITKHNLENMPGITT